MGRVYYILSRPESTDLYKGSALGNNRHDKLVREFIPDLATVIEPLVALSRLRKVPNGRR